MWPFSLKPQSYLGVDIGSYGIKMVELLRKGKRAHLYTYSYSTQNLTGRSSEASGFLDVESAAELLKRMKIRAKTKSNLALASLPASAVYNFVISVPLMKKEEEGDFIKRQAQKFIPLSLAEVVLDWKIINVKKDGDKKGYREVLFSAAPRQIIASYSEIFKRAGLTLLSLESEIFGMISSLIGKDPSPILLVDIGAAQTDFMLVENGVPFLFHSISLGGQSFTEAIQKSMGVDATEAEQIKHDLKSEQGFPTLFEPLLKPVEEAVRYIFELYSKQKETREAKPDKIILTGGSSLLPHMDTRLSALFNMKVYLGDPWARIVYDETLKPVLDTIGPRFAVSLGLALKKIEN